MQHDESAVKGEFFIDFYEKVHSAQTAQETFSIIRNISTAFGFTYHSIVYIPEAVETALRPHIVSSNWPGALLDEYDQHHLLANSPIMRELRAGLLPVTFDLETVGPTPTEGELSATRDLFLGHQMPRGVFFPCFDSRGRKGAIGFSGERSLPTVVETPVLHMLSSYAFNRLHTLIQEDKSFAGLTKRETECLFWAARGKTNAECSKVLGISENTVAGYLASASRKLSAKNKAHMIAIAYEKGLLSRHNGV